jgi:hypothetical protein
MTTSKKDIVKFINEKISHFDILMYENNGKEYFFIDNGGGSDNDFTEIGVETLIEIVQKAYIRGLAEGLAEVLE